jgi:hypothetical protein
MPQANHKQLRRRRPRLIQSQRFLPPDPLRKVRDGLEPDIIEAVLLGLLVEVLDGELEDFGAPHAWAEGVGELGEALVGGVFEGGGGEGGLQGGDELGVVFLGRCEEG